uniref:Uncharacterized protein n=1 Tax=Anguilla anguilla TaxID=7936 RepID=A0A0E9WU15_ANGAN
MCKACGGWSGVVLTRPRPDMLMFQLIPRLTTAPPHPTLPCRLPCWLNPSCFSKLQFPPLSHPVPGISPPWPMPFLPPVFFCC